MSETYSITVTAVALAAATAKTIIEIGTPSTGACRLIGLEVSFDGVTAAAVPVAVEVMKFAATGTGSAYTPLKMNGEAQNRAAVCTAKTSDTVEPASQTRVVGWKVSPYGGLWVYQWPLGRELYLPPSSFFGIRCTAPAIVNVDANLTFEE